MLLLLQKLKMGHTIRSRLKLYYGIFDALEKKNHLLVFDDVATLSHWNEIISSLPDNNSVKVIVTTCSKEFLKKPNSYHISGLSRPEFHMLLRNQANFPNDSSEKIENAIFDICGGSPLFGTILGKSLQSEIGHYDQLLINELGSYSSHKGKPQVLGVCYQRLAPELKRTLLYLGQFPQGHNIEVERLYMLLALNPLTLQSFKHKLKDLASKNLIELQEDCKSCRLRGQVWEFCKSKGSDEGIFEILYLESQHKRAIYYSKYKGEAQNSIVSLLVFGTSELAENKSKWPSEIKNLKKFRGAIVVSFDGVDFTVRKVPKGIDKLVQLKYLSFRGCRLKELPASLGNLTQLETLDLFVHADCKDAAMLLIPNNLFAKMTRMRHLFFPKLYAASIRKAKVQLQGLVRLETLVNFDAEVCDIKDLSSFENLEILSLIISNGKSTHLEEAVDFIERLGENLKVDVDITSFKCGNYPSSFALDRLLDRQLAHSVHIEGNIGALSDKGRSGAGKVAEIVLNNTHLEEDPMKWFGKFQNLQSFVLS